MAEKIEGLTINEAEYPLTNGRKGKLAIFMYSGQADPSRVLDYAVSEYVGRTGYHELIDARLSNPWMRVVLSNINDLPQDTFRVGEHTLGHAVEDA